MNRYWIALIILLTGCAQATGTPEPTVIPTPTREPTSTATGSLIITNTFDEALCEIYIEPYYEPTWGDNDMPVGRIAPGEERTFTGINVGVMDIRAVGCDGVDSAIYGVPIDGPGERWAAGTDEFLDPFELQSDKVSSAQLTIINQSEQAICELYLVPAYETAWDRPRFTGEDRIPPGASQVFTLAPNRYNLRVDSCEAAYGSAATPAGVHEVYDITIDEAGYTWRVSFSD